MYDNDRDDGLETDFHEIDKSRRIDRLKKNKQDKGKNCGQWDDGSNSRPKRHNNGRHQEKKALRDMMRQYL